MIIACATDDEEKFINKHFGDARKYMIYNINDEGNIKFIKRIINTVDEEEEVHADPEKAKGIKDLLQAEDVQVLLSKKFGSNIIRVRKHFVPVVVKDERVEEGLVKLSKNINKVNEEWKKGKSRDHIVL